MSLRWQMQLQELSANGRCSSMLIMAGIFGCKVGRYIFLNSKGSERQTKEGGIIIKYSLDFTIPWTLKRGRVETLIRQSIYWYICSWTLMSFWNISGGVRVTGRDGKWSRVTHCKVDELENYSPNIFGKYIFLFSTETETYDKMGNFI